MPIVRVAALVLSLFSATLAHAAVQRTFVASTGVDANTAFNCSIANPCRTFTAAMGVTGAKGEVIVLDSAGYGAVSSITKSVTITAPAGIYAGISVFSGDGITIDGSGIIVVLRGLTINGQGGNVGIMIVHAGTVHVENCVISAMADSGIRQLEGMLETKDTVVRNNAYGIFVHGPAQANLDRVRLEANATGLAAEFGGQVAMQDSLVTGSSNIGVVAAYTGPPSSRVTITRSLISSNNYGLYVIPSAGKALIWIFDSTLSGNTVGAHVEGNGALFSGQMVAARTNVMSAGTGIEVSNKGLLLMDANVFYQDEGVPAVWDLTLDATAVVYSRQNNTVGGCTNCGAIIGFPAQ